MKLVTPSIRHASFSDWQSVYEPAEDSFLLIDALEADLKFILLRKPSICVEVGSGSGVVLTSLATALKGQAWFIATDINPIACKLTENTAQANGTTADSVHVDLAPLREGVIDLVIFNPPYVPSPSCELTGNGLQRSWAGGERGREVVDRFLAMIVPALSPSGVGYLLLLQENDPQEVAGILRQAGCVVKEVAQRRIRGEYLIVLRFHKHLTASLGKVS